MNIKEVEPTIEYVWETMHEDTRKKFKKNKELLYSFAYNCIRVHTEKLKEDVDDAWHEVRNAQERNEQ